MTPLHLMTALQAARRRSVSGSYLWVDHAAWREEVQLATGEIVVVGRLAVANKSGFPVPRRGPHRRWQITFPDGKTIWESDGLTQPLSIEVKEGSYFLAADIHSRLLCAKYGDPEGSVLFFRREDGAWTRIARAAYPKNSKVNLLRNPWGRNAAEDAHGLIRHEDKHLRAGNHLVHVALDERIANRAVDSCRLPEKLQRLKDFALSQRKGTVLRLVSRSKISQTLRPLRLTQQIRQIVVR
jgi:hypothetical protein